MEGKIDWKSLPIPPDLFVQSLRFNLIQLGKINIQHDLLPTHQEDLAHHYLIRNECLVDVGFHLRKILSAVNQKQELSCLENMTSLKLAI